MNLEVKSGDYVALVGTSGAGKTTLLQSDPQDPYDVSSGAIYLDGKDIRKIKLKDLRDHIGIVQQDVYLFAGNIMESIQGYGRPDATDEGCISGRLSWQMLMILLWKCRIIMVQILGSVE